MTKTIFSRTWTYLQDPPLVVGAVILFAFLVLAIFGAAAGAELAR